VLPALLSAFEPTARLCADTRNYPALEQIETQL